MYTKDDVANIEKEVPGKFPYTRGPYATMYTVKPWTIRQVFFEFPFYFSLSEMKKFKIKIK